MEKGDLFWWLVDYHCNINLKESLSKIRNGVLVNNGGRYPEGTDRGCPYQGVLIIANGSTLAERLVRDHIVHDQELSDFVDAGSKAQFLDYLRKQETDDGAYVYDGSNGKMAHVEEINNDPPLPAGFSMCNMVPKDFFFVDGKQPKPMIGTKTRLAIKVPQAYENTEAFQIKRSRYGTLGMGKVTHFTDQGLAKEFLFAYDPSYDGPFINRRKGIIGLLRTYQRDDNGQLYRASQEIFDPSRLR